jgi:hypothetical protein
MIGASFFLKRRCGRTPGLPPERLLLPPLQVEQQQRHVRSARAGARADGYRRGRRRAEPWVVKSFVLLCTALHNYPYYY